MKPFYYKRPDGTSSFCAFKVLTSTAGVIVVLAELPGSPEALVSDRVSHVATILYTTQIRYYKAEPESVVWVEQRRIVDPAAPDSDAASYDQVLMVWEGSGYHSPLRVPFPKEHWGKYHLS